MDVRKEADKVSSYPIIKRWLLWTRQYLYMDRIAHVTPAHYRLVSLSEQPLLNFLLLLSTSYIKHLAFIWLERLLLQVILKSFSSDTRYL